MYVKKPPKKVSFKAELVEEFAALNIDEDAFEAAWHKFWRIGAKGTFTLETQDSATTDTTYF